MFGFLRKKEKPLPEPWYMCFSGSNLLSKEDKQFLDQFTEDDFNGLSIVAFTEDILLKGKKFVTIKEGVTRLREWLLQWL